MAISVNDLELINDAYGPSAGDTLLVELAERLRSCARADDVVGRVGGNCFVVLWPAATEGPEPGTIASRILNLVEPEPIEIANDRLDLNLTIGVADRTPGSRGAALIADSIEALAHSSAAGDPESAVASRHVPGAADRRVRLRAALRGAVARLEISIVLQPVVELGSRLPKGFEALARWEHPDLGHVSPGEFIPEAEAMGRVNEIGEVALEEACSKLAGLRLRHGRELSVSVNVAAVQLQQYNFAQRVGAILDSSSLPGSALLLELTERALIERHFVESRNLRQLEELGVRIALGDFGTGYSALGALQNLPIDVLKVDRSIIEKLGEAEASAAILKAVVAMAAALQMSVVAEGIETEAQHALALELGCHLGQGYLSERPLTLAAVDALEIDYFTAPLPQEA